MKFIDGTDATKYAEAIRPAISDAALAIELWGDDMLEFWASQSKATEKSDD